MPSRHDHRKKPRGPTYLFMCPGIGRKATWRRRADVCCCAAWRRLFPHCAETDPPLASAVRLPWCRLSLLIKAIGSGNGRRWFERRRLLCQSFAWPAGNV